MSSDRKSVPDLRTDRMYHNIGFGDNADEPAVIVDNG